MSFGKTPGINMIAPASVFIRKKKENGMRKIRRKQAAVPTWILIATLGLSPMVSAAGVPVETENGGMVYSEAGSRMDGDAVKDTLDIEIASPSSAGTGDTVEGNIERESEGRAEDNAEAEDKVEAENNAETEDHAEAKDQPEAGTEADESENVDNLPLNPDSEKQEDGREDKYEKEHGEEDSGDEHLEQEPMAKATPSEALPEVQEATPSNAVMMTRSANLWGGMEMSDHFDGEGTEESPYEIHSSKDLKLLAYNVSNEEVDGYADCYFALTRDISLSDSASWLPIGYFTATGDTEPHPFKGNFNGNGYRIYNLKISDTTQSYAGLFGSVHGAVIENLTVDGQVNADSKAAVLAGETNDSVIKNCVSKGQVRGVGVIGGIVGESYDSVILECSNTAGVLGGTDAMGDKEAFAGGICGSAQGSFISDCASDTTDSYSALYSEGYVGGIAGNIYETEVYNSYVEGKVGSTSADYIGGLVGRLQSGQVKNGRFAGTIGASTSATLKTAGLFVGYIEGGTVELGDDLAYLYADSEDKYSLNPFGNKLTPQIRLEHHIGAYYSNQRDYSLYQLGGFTKQTNRYFYEELEEGVLGIGKENVHHYAPSKTGDPVRGYMVSIPAIDHGTLSVLESQNNFAKEIDWANPGALAAGTKVLVYTSPVNDTEPPVYYELEPDSLFWTADDFDSRELIQTEASEVAFTMPEQDIILSATYRAMTNGVILDRSELTFDVEQIRSGSRWNPQIGWKVTDPQKLTATIIPDSAANKNIYWSVKDTDGSSTDVISVDEDGVVSVNTSAKWIQDLIKAGVTNQELYPSKKITTEGTGYASVTVTTEAGQKRASAFVTVNFKITDDTVVPVSGVELDQAELAFEVTRTLEGDRIQPSETYSVTPSKRLYETVSPEYADHKEVTWAAGDGDMLRVDQAGMVSARADSRWIADLIRTEEEKNRENPYAVRAAGGSRSSYVTVTTKDGGKQAVCAVNLSFRTVDNTVVHAEDVALNQSEVTFMVEKLMTGSRTSPKVEYKVTQPQQLTVTVTPEETQNKKVGWNLADNSMAAVSEEGLITVKRDAKWIRDLEAVDEANVAKNRYALSTASGTRETAVTATTEDGQKTALCKIVVEFKTTDQTTAPSSSSSGGSGGGGSSSGGGGSSSRSSAGSASGPGKESGEWFQDTVGWWYKNQDGSYPKSCWQQLSYNATSEWYHFDEKGYMQTGWFTDVDGNIYYLHAVGDGTRGRMVTGWNLIDEKWYYFNTVSDGTRGALFINRETPDGFRVDAYGCWIP